MRATLPLYTSAARAQNRVEVGSELMTSRRRVGGTRARCVWRGGISPFVLVRRGQSGAIRAFQTARIISLGTGVISDKHKTVSGFYLVGRRL